MRKVEFVHVKSAVSGYGLGKGIKYSFIPEAEEIVRERLEQDWEYGGYLPVQMRGDGEMEEISLIFYRNE
ncbi:MAG: DUF4177 domain-containing protein [Clostridia bacterium]|nr:DUF4177 domain-containing protein [Clostridia bacterium]MBQ9925344.1 DUF4177 domain-containing protein [Clostridia bacterium]